MTFFYSGYFNVLTGGYDGVPGVEVHSYPQHVTPIQLLHDPGPYQVSSRVLKMMCK